MSAVTAVKLFKPMSVLALILAMVLSVWVGSVDLWSLQDPQVFADILWNIRLPRLLSAALCGCLLASAGVLSQALFANPIATPSTIGTTSGGIFGVSLMFFVFEESATEWSVSLAAILGSSLATALLFVFRSATPMSLLINGIALSSIFSALSSLLMAMASESLTTLPTLLSWLLGSLHSPAWPELGAMMILTLVLLVLAQMLLAPLEIMTFGSEHAGALGIDTAKITVATVLLMASLEGLSISGCGAIAFVGLIVPHFVRPWVGPHLRPLFFWSAVNGATLVLTADLFARTIRSPSELPVGVVIALIGSPLFLLLVRKEVQR